MTRPVVGTVAEELYAALPPRWAKDDAVTGYTLLHFCEAISGPGMQHLADRALDAPDGTPGWASLFNLPTASSQQAAYLGQYVGVVVPPGSSTSKARRLVRERSGFARGRPATIVAAVRALLTGSQIVTLLERTDGAWTHTIRVWRSQVLDEAAIEQVLAEVKPAGDIFTLVLVNGPSYGDIYAALPAGNKTYGARKAMFPTYGDVKEYIP